MTTLVPFLSSEYQNLFKPMLPFFVWIFVLLCFILSGGFAFGALNPHTVCLLTNPALLLSPPPRRPSLQRHTQVACPLPSPHLSLLFQSCHCVPGRLQNSEFLADDGVALSPSSEPTPVMPGIWESAFHRLLWHFESSHPTSYRIWQREGRTEGCSAHHQWAHPSQRGNKKTKFQFMNQEAWTYEKACIPQLPDPPSWPFYEKEN